MRSGQWVPVRAERVAPICLMRTALQHTRSANNNNNDDVDVDVDVDGTVNNAQVEEVLCQLTYQDITLFNAVVSGWSSRMMMPRDHSSRGGDQAIADGVDHVPQRPASSRPSSPRANEAATRATSAAASLRGAAALELDDDEGGGDGDDDSGDGQPWGDQQVCRGASYLALGPFESALTPCVSTLALLGGSIGVEVAQHAKRARRRSPLFFFYSRHYHVSSSVFSSG